MHTYIIKIAFYLSLIVGLAFSFSIQAKDNTKKHNDILTVNLIEKVTVVTQAQNKVMMHNSTKSDVDHLFSMYSDDFVYIHEVYGGKYSKENLYNNTVKYLKSGGYNKVEDRYTVVSYLVGLNTVAVQRKENKNGALHLAVFEFKQDKVSKITEYWK